MSHDYILASSYDIVQQPLPQVNRAKYRTKYASVSDFNFSGIHLPWDGFENEVRKTIVA